MSHPQNDDGSELDLEAVKRSHEIGTEIRRTTSHGLDHRLGYAPLPRDLRYHAIMRRPSALALYVWLLLRARATPATVDLAGGIVHLKAGQCCYGQREAADALGVGHETIKRAEKWLEKRSLIARKPTRRGTILTICGYGDFKKRIPSEQPTDEPTDESTYGSTAESVRNGGNGRNGSNRRNGDPDQEQDRAGARFPAGSSSDEKRRVRDLERRREDQEVAKAAKRIADTWNSWNATKEQVAPAGFDYVLRGLRLADDPGALVEDLLGEIPRGSGSGIAAGDTLWQWHRRRTGEWLGAEDDVRFR